MDEPRIITAIDVGTTKVFAMVAAVDGNRPDGAKPRVLAHATVPSRGLMRGNVEDVAETTMAVRAALDLIEAEAGIEIESAYIGVTGAHVKCENRRDRLDGVGSIGVITPQELEAGSPLPFGSPQQDRPDENRQVIHAMPISYTLDGEQGIRNPIGMHSRSVEVDTHVITADRARLQLLTQAVRDAGIEVDALVMEPLASGLATLTRDEMDRGTLLIDIGGGTCDMVAFRGGRVSYTGVVPIGGYQFTNDICLTYNVDRDSAEQAKLEHGHTEPAAVDPDGMVSMSLADRPTNIPIPARELAQLLRERATEMAQLIRIKLDDAKSGQVGSVKVVLTGGASELPGIADIIQRYLGRRVRLCSPSRAFEGAEGLSDPMHATGLGILTWAASQPVPAKARRASRANGRAGNTGRLAEIGAGVGRQVRKLRLSPWMASAMGSRQT
jgi:cell division protein FtsA